MQTEVKALLVQRRPSLRTQLANLRETRVRLYQTIHGHHDWRTRSSARRTLEGVNREIDRVERLLRRYVQHD